MEKLESSLKNMVSVLVGVALLTGALLAGVNHLTEQPKKIKAEKTLSDGICQVMGGKRVAMGKTDTLRSVVEGKECVLVIHHVDDGSGTELGAAVESTVQGFGGELKVLAGFDKEGVISGYTILQSSETPGLGAKANQWFQKDGKGNIIGLSPRNKELSVSKDGGTVDAITASTITSRAFLRAVNQAYHAYVARKVDGDTGASSKAEHKS